MQRDHKGKANLIDLAKQWIKTRHNKPGKAFAGLVHRLDGPVAGVVVVARTSKGASRLSAQIRQGSVEKRYLAVVEGRPSKAAGHLRHQLVRKGRKSQIAPKAIPGSQAASLRYQKVASDNQRSMMAITLETGRRHQIRVQMAAMGCPIVGDIHYGAAGALPHGRIALLAHQLAFDHPTRRHRLRFESPLPEGWPWPLTQSTVHGPLWTIEDYFSKGLILSEL